MVASGCVENDNVFGTPTATGAGQIGYDRSHRLPLSSRAHLPPAALWMYPLGPVVVVQ